MGVDVEAVTVLSAESVVVLAGGVGAARFLQGVATVLPRHLVTVIGNVGDDIDVCGLHVSPDLDTVLYTLTGAIDPERGWGVRDDTSRALERARSLGASAWFWLGDLDIGLHLARTEWLQEGMPLSTATARLATAMGLEERLLPCTDGRLRTMIGTADGEIDFQTYYVRRGHADVVTSIRFDGADTCVPGPGVVDALGGASALVIAPSNPLISIDPILAVPGIREALEQRASPCVAVSPIVGGQALRGPAADMLHALGHAASPVAVARLYAGLIDVMLIDDADAHLATEVEATGARAVVTDTIMRDQDSRARLAAAALRAAGLSRP